MTEPILEGVTVEPDARPPARGPREDAVDTAESNPETPEGDPPRARRRRRDRAQTEADLRDAARRLLEAHGVLAGLNLREVAAAAGVNRGQIYQYYGSRQALLRAAISDLLEANSPDAATHWEQPFALRRHEIFEWALDQADVIKLEALLALDGDEELRPFPALHRTIQALERDHDQGDLRPDVDGMAAHVVTAATYMGYCIFREAYARNAGIPVAELDERVLEAFDGMVSGLTGPTDGASTGTAARGGTSADA